MLAFRELGSSEVACVWGPLFSLCSPGSVCPRAQQRHVLGARGPSPGAPFPPPGGHAGWVGVALCPQETSSPAVEDSRNAEATGQSAAQNPAAPRNAAASRGGTQEPLPEAEVDPRPLGGPSV